MCNDLAELVFFFVATAPRRIFALIDSEFVKFQWLKQLIAVRITAARMLFIIMKVQIVAVFVVA